LKKDKYVCWKEGKEPQIIESDCYDEALREYDFKDMDSKEYYYNIKDITKHYQCYKLKRDVEELIFNSFSWFDIFTYGEKGNTIREGLIVSVNDEFVEFFGGRKRNS